MPYISQAYLASLGDAKRARLLATNSPIGYHPDTEDRFFIPNQDRFAGTYILGVQGVGKSRLLENLIAHDVQNNQAIIVFDPHRDLTLRSIAQLPEHVIPKTYLFDMEDEAYPFGVNLFSGLQKSTAITQAQAIDRVMHIFEVLWGDILNQQYLPRYLRAATIVLLANPGATLVDMYSFLTDDATRRSMLQNVQEPTVKQFWKWFGELSLSARRQQIEPIIGRLEALFMGRSLVRNIVGQRETSINFRKAIENREIIFIRLPIKTLPQDARLIGTLMIAQIHAAIFSFSDLPEAKRPGFSLYIDEAQHFATPDFTEMFTEGRKFGVRVTVAHQYRGQLPIYLRESTMTARTKVCFQTPPDDSREMAHIYLHGETDIRPDDIEPRPVEYLLHHGSDIPIVQSFIDYYIRPLQAFRGSGMIEILKPGFRTEHLGYWVLSAEAPKENPKVADPTPYLNHLLYEVMKTGNGGLSIPPEIVQGFSNSGRGFYRDFLNTLHKGKMLSIDIEFPPYLVVEDSKGIHWTRQPEGGKEQLYHFLFYLRSTMANLAKHPLGKKTALSVSEVSQMLTRLPNRAAFVRSGEDVGVIYTDNTLPSVNQKEQLKRLLSIRDQTRHKYCKPKDQISQTPAQPVTAQPLSRWEEVQ